MILRGFEWGVYSLRGASSATRSRMTAANFFESSRLAVLLFSLCRAPPYSFAAGIGGAVLSGRLPRAWVMAIWYTVCSG